MICKLALNLFTNASWSRFSWNQGPVIGTAGKLSCHNQIKATYSPYFQQDAEASANTRLIIH